MSVTEAEFEAIRDRMAANRRKPDPWIANAFSAAAPRKRSKFGNVKKEVDGHVFDSSAEARRYIELKAMQAAGQITNLELQPRYTLLEKFTDGTGKKHRAVEYRGDFQYRLTDVFDMATICEDVKGVQTAAFRIKWKMAIRKYPEVRFGLSR